MAVLMEITGGSVHLSGNPIKVTLTASAPLLGHKLLLKVTYAQQFGGSQTDEIVPNNLAAEFDISGLCDNPVEYNFEFPAQGKVKAYSALAFVVTINYGESYLDANGDRQESWEAGSSQIRVIKGRLLPYQLALFNQANTNFNAEFIEAGKFLTWLPNNMIVAPDQIVKLYYLSRWTDNHDAVLHFDALCSDGQTRSITEATTLIASGLFEFSISPFHVGIVLPAGVTVLQYTFYLTDAVTQEDISEHRTFVVDNEYYEKTFIIYYVNPLSGIDSIWLTGNYSEKVATENETAFKPVPAGSGTQTPSITTVSASQQRFWEINTRDKTKDEMRALRWFLAAKERWMTDPDDATKLIPVYVEGGEHLLDETDWYIRNNELKIFEAHK